MLTTAGAIALAVVACSSTGGTSPTAAEAQSSVDPTGILLVGLGEHVQSGPAAEVVAMAFDQALQSAQAHPNDLGYPWIDPSSDELVLSAATAAGRTLLEATVITVSHRIRDAAHSYAELQQIQDDVTRLSAQGVTDAQLIYMTAPDQRDNRTMIVISQMSRPLSRSWRGGLRRMRSRFR